MNLLPCEAGALVYDLGSSTIQFGFAGDAQPLFSVPSRAAQGTRDLDDFIEFGHTWLKKQIPGLDIRPMIDDRGCLVDPELLCSFFDWTYQACLSVESSERPVLLTQPSHLYKVYNGSALSKWRRSLCEAMFEFAQHPAVCLEHDSVLACFSHAAHTAIVVDFGWAYMRAVPIQAGRPLLASMQLQKGGLDICKLLEQGLEREGRRVITQFDAPGCSVIPTESQRRYCQNEVLKDIVGSCLSFLPPTDTSMNRYEYYMPGHNYLNVKDHMALLARSIPCHALLQAAISNEHTPADVRKQLWGNIVMSGGLSNLPGFDAWLEMSPHGTKQMYTARVLRKGNRDTARYRIVSGSNTVWAGGSILASLDTFNEFCITKQEWQETGEAILQNKCC